MGAVIAIFVVMTIIMVSFSTSTVAKYGEGNDLDYAPGDTRIIPFSNTFCQGLKLTNVDWTESSYLSLYLLNSSPQLTGNESFSINEKPEFDVYDYYYYYFYLYPGSTITASPCATTTSYFFYLIKGNKQFGQWKSDYHSHYKDRFNVSTCGMEGTKSYDIQEEDYYFMVFRKSDQHTADDLTVNLGFIQTYYVFSNDSVVNSCTVDYPPSIDHNYCTVSVPLFAGGTVLLTVKPVPDLYVFWSEGLDLDVQCVPRVWLYAVIGLSVLLVSIVLLTLVVVCVCVCAHWRRKKQLMSVPAVSTDVASSRTSYPPPEEDPSAAPLMYNQPINQDYESNYGSIYEAPPKYNP